MLVGAQGCKGNRCLCPVCCWTVLLNEAAFAPLQLAQLPRLAALDMICGYSSASMAALSQLTSLTSLVLDPRREWPPAAALAQLTQLCKLCIDCSAIQAAPLDVAALPGLLAAALPALQQLTCLKVALRVAGLVPPPFAALSQLRELWWWRRFDMPSDAHPMVFAQAHSLQRLQLLGLEWLTAATSLPALAAMPALRELWLVGVPDASTAVLQQQWEAVCTFAEQHPPLRRLHLFACYAEAPVRQQCARLHRHRPELMVHVRSSAWDFF